ncbi:hypothetical protein NPIL_623051 [Nephila pilipes]|uniref:Uncharacterized protein n=1 Tax=Nephila pilipes TaxID=299642 RepID=A0A8X6UV45_NEPPI|nr:hypothetical protein NPIL_623051 [Nephila pilipes]
MKCFCYRNRAGIRKENDASMENTFDMPIMRDYLQLLSILEETFFCFVDFDEGECKHFIVFGNSRLAITVLMALIICIIGLLWWLSKIMVE